MQVEMRLYVEIDPSWGRDAADMSYDDVATVIGNIAQGAMDVATNERVHVRHFDAIVLATMQKIDFDRP